MSDPELLNLQCADAEDWSKCCFPVGLKVHDQQNPWLEMDVDELKVLKNLIQKRLLTVNADGYVSHLPPVASEYPALNKLALWAEAVLHWAEAHPDKLSREPLPPLGDQA